MPSLTMFQRSALGGRAHNVARRLSAQRHDREAKTVDWLLEAGRFHSCAVQALAHPRHFARAASLLETATGARNLTAALQSRVSDPVRAFRICVALQLFPDRVPPLITLDDLRSDRRPGATIALAALGELPDWSAASREARAAYAIGRLIVAFRERAS